MAEPVATVTVEAAVPGLAPTPSHIDTQHDFIFTPEGREAHLAAALSVALKEAPPLADDESPTADKSVKGISADPAIEAELASAVDPDKQSPVDEVLSKDTQSTEKPVATEDKPDEGTAAGTLGKARRLFEEGDLDGALKLALGVELDAMGGVTLKSRHFKSLVAREKAAQASVREAEAKSAEQAAHVQQAAQALLPMIHAINAYEKGDYETFIQKATGKSLETFQRQILESFKLGSAPAPRTDPAIVAQLEEIKRERAAEKAEAQRLKDENKRLQEAQGATKWQREVAQELAASKFAKLAEKPAFVKHVQDVQRANYNPKTQMTLDAVEAAQFVYDELYDGVTDIPAETAALAAKGASTGRTGTTGASGSASNTGRTSTPNISVTAEAAPDLATLPWSADNQKRILEAAMRRAKSEMHNGV